MSIRPALTPEEWAAFPNSHLVQAVELVDGTLGHAQTIAGEPLPLWFPTPHGTAAVNLHGQPFGFTREMLEALRSCVHMAGERVTTGAGWLDHAEAALVNLEALLPPEGA